MGPFGVVDLVLGTVGAAVFWVGVAVAIFVLVRRFLPAVERRSVPESHVAGLTERLQRVEEQLYELVNENERLREDQRFTSELLLERPISRHEPASGSP